MSSPGIANIPGGIYSIRAAGTDTKDNYLTAVPRGSSRGYDLYMKDKEHQTSWVVDDFGDLLYYAIYPHLDPNCACAGLTSKELVAIPKREAAVFERVWAFYSTGKENTYAVWRLGEAEGTTDYWTWDGLPSSPVSLSQNMGPNTLFIFEKLE